MNFELVRAPLRAFLIAAVAALAFAIFAAGPGAAVAEAKCSKANAPAKKLRKKEIRAALRCVVNKERGRNLSPKDQLHEAAQDHTGRMRRSGCLSHQCPGEPSLYERIRRTGYFNGASSYSYGEVIARAGAGASPRDIVRLWMGSSSHRATLMNSGFEHLGVGSSVKGGKGIYTIVVGSRSG